jgi:hypothetical protein
VKGYPRIPTCFCCPVAVVLIKKTYVLLGGNRGCYTLTCERVQCTLIGCVASGGWAGARHEPAHTDPPGTVAAGGAPLNSWEGSCEGGKGCKRQQTGESKRGGGRTGQGNLDPKGLSTRCWVSKGFKVGQGQRIGLSLGTGCRGTCCGGLLHPPDKTTLTALVCFGLLGIKWLCFGVTGRFRVFQESSGMF